MGILSKLLGVMSGGSGVKLSDQLLFDKIIGFKGVTPGVGTSTVVHNIAEAVSNNTNYMICIVDMSILFPTQYALTAKKDTKGTNKDFFDFDKDIKDITIPTNIKKTRLLSFNNRTVRDMMSTKDTENLVLETFSQLKSYFDLILVDLSHELTVVNTQAAISCNKVVYVADPSAKTMFNLQRTINMMGTLAVPPAKADRVILNKTVPDLAVNTKSALEDAGLRVIAELPLGIEIAKEGVVGRPAWGSSDTNREIRQFTSQLNEAISDIISLGNDNESGITKNELTSIVQKSTAPKEDESAISEGVQADLNVAEGTDSPVEVKAKKGFFSRKQK